MIQQKLTILLENDVIDEATFQYMQDVLAFMKKENVIADDDEADTFITHLAMATIRSRRNEEQVDSVDQFIKDEIEAAPEYAEAVALWKKISAHVKLDFPASENDYFYLHLVTLLQNKN